MNKKGFTAVLVNIFSLIFILLVLVSFYLFTYINSVFEGESDQSVTAIKERDKNILMINFLKTPLINEDEFEIAEEGDTNLDFFKRSADKYKETSQLKYIEDANKITYYFFNNTYVEGKENYEFLILGNNELCDSEYLLNDEYKFCLRAKNE